MARSILVIDDASSAATSMRQVLQSAGYVVEVAKCGQDGLKRMRVQFFDMILIEISLSDVPGMELLHFAIQQRRCQFAIMMAVQGSIAQAVSAVRAGAIDFLPKPVDPQSLLSTLQNAFNTTNDFSTPLKTAIAADCFQAWRDDFASSMIGEHPLMLAALHAIRRIAQTNCDVLITGASGTGKELVARSIHMASRRCQRAFVALNCAAIPKELMESEIFGHARGAFTGATERRAGKFEIANGGSLFLDEVGEMEMSLQSKLLRVLQEREVTPVGESRVVNVDVRIIAATNQELEQLCRDRSFREDLYYRLNVVPVQLPTLAERSSDIPLLVSHFIKRANRRHGRNIKGFNACAATALCQYTWPGNIRELHNVIERIAVLKPDDSTIGVEDLPPAVCKRSASASTRVGGAIVLPQEGLDINETLACMEERLTSEALERAGGNKARAAELLGLKRTTLVERLKKLNLSEVVQ